MEIDIIKRFLVRWLIVCVGTLLWFQPTISAACSVEIMPGFVPLTFEEQIERSSVIVEGTIIGISRDKTTATIQVSRYLKGSGADQINVHGFTDGMCGPTAIMGDTGVAYIKPQGNNYELDSSGVMTLDQAKITQISAIVGHEPIVPTVSYDVTSWLNVMVGAVVIVVLGMLMMRRRTLQKHERNAR